MEATSGDPIGEREAPMNKARRVKITFRINLVLLMSGVGLLLLTARGSTASDQVPLGSSIAYFRTQLNLTEQQNDSKCWTTFRRVEGMLAGLRFHPQAAHVRGDLAQTFAGDVWKMAQDVETSETITPSSVNSALRSFFWFILETHPVTQVSAWRLYPKIRGNITIEPLELENYEATAEGWRVLLAAAFNERGAITKDLEPQAAEIIFQYVNLYSLTLSKLAGRLTVQDGLHEVTTSAITQANAIMRRRTISDQPMSVRRSLAQSIWYVRDKIANLAQVNGPVDDGVRQQSEARIAEIRVDRDASKYLHQVILPELAKTVWLQAQAEPPKDRWYVSGERMWLAFETLFPYSADEEEHIRFFPDSDHPVFLYSHWCDAFRDDRGHWQAMLDVLTVVDDLQKPRASVLYTALDPYALEEMADGLAGLGVLLLRQAASVAQELGHGAVTPQHLQEARFVLEDRSRATQRIVRSEKSPADEVLTATMPDPILSNTATTFFQDVTARSGLPGRSKTVLAKDPDADAITILNKHARGAAVEDYDRDGNLDLFLGGVYGGLFKNIGGMRFKDTTESAGLDLKQAPYGAVFGDIDNDGWPDLFLINRGAPARLFMNNQDGTFRDVTAASGIETAGFANMALWFDYDQDGDVDLYLVNGRNLQKKEHPNVGDAQNAAPNRLFRNNGDLTFTDVTAQAGVGDTRWAQAATVLDFDGDRLQDIYITNDFGKNVLYRNLGDGTFEDVAGTAGVADLGHGMGVSVGDIDHDGWPDLYVTNIGMYNLRTRYIRPNTKTAVQTSDYIEQFWLREEANRLYRNNRDGTFTDIVKERMEPISTGWGWNGMFFDFDNDGYLDLHVANGFKPRAFMYRDEPNVLIHYDPQLGRFRDVSTRSGLDFASNSRGGAFADFDRDGFLDMVVVGMHPPRLFRNTMAGNGNHWIRVTLRGVLSSRDSIGAKVQVTAGDLVQTSWMGQQGGNLISQCPNELYFGLGSHERVDSIRVEWPSGLVKTYRDVPVNRHFSISEPDQSIQRHTSRTAPEALRAYD